MGERWRTQQATAPRRESGVAQGHNAGSLLPHMAKRRRHPLAVFPTAVENDKAKKFASPVCLVSLLTRKPKEASSHVHLVGGLGRPGVSTDEQVVAVTLRVKVASSWSPA